MMDYLKNYLLIVVIITSALMLHSSAAGQFAVQRISMSSLLDFEQREVQPFPKVHYNRVEGLYIGGGVRVNPEFLPSWTLIGESGYGISNEEWRYRAEIQKKFFETNKLKFGVRLFHSTVSQDDWYIGWIENSLAALFFNNDYMDYFARKGYLAFANQDLMDNRIRLRLELANYDYETMERNTNWSLFRKDHNYRLNPAVTDGNETGIKLIASFDCRDNPLFPLSGWLIDGIYEHTSGDFESDGLFFVVRRFQPTFGSQRIRTKLLAGSRRGSLASQHLLDLGGLGTLPGYEVKEFSGGNRMLLFSLNYQFGGDLLRKLPLDFVPLYDALALTIFTDSGWLNLVGKNDGLADGFDKLRAEDFKTDVGFSFSVSEEMLVAKFAKRTDRNDDAWHFLVRMMYKF